VNSVPNCSWPRQPSCRAFCCCGRFFPPPSFTPLTTSPSFILNWPQRLGLAPSSLAARSARARTDCVARAYHTPRQPLFLLAAHRHLSSPFSGLRVAPLCRARPLLVIPWPWLSPPRRPRRHRCLVFSPRSPDKGPFPATNCFFSPSRLVHRGLVLGACILDLFLAAKARPPGVHRPSRNAPASAPTWAPSRCCRCSPCSPHAHIQARLHLRPFNCTLKAGRVSPHRPIRIRRASGRHRRSRLLLLPPSPSSCRVSDAVHAAACKLRSSLANRALQDAPPLAGVRRRRAACCRLRAARTLLVKLPQILLGLAQLSGHTAPRGGKELSPAAARTLRPSCAVRSRSISPPGWKPSRCR